MGKAQESGGFSKKLKVGLTYYSAISILEIYLKLKADLQRDICTPMFIATLFRIANS